MLTVFSIYIYKSVLYICKKWKSSRSNKNILIILDIRIGIHETIDLLFMKKKIFEHLLCMVNRFYIENIIRIAHYFQIIILVDVSIFYISKFKILVEKYIFG